MAVKDLDADVIVIGAGNAACSAAMAARDFSSIPMAVFRTSRGGDELADGVEPEPSQQRRQPGEHGGLDDGGWLELVGFHD